MNADPALFAPQDADVVSEAGLLGRIAREQRRAADPGAFAFVSANAGAGKTKVLCDRVLRLLLAGTPPGRILCLTFTKVAAATMAIRVFERLGRWVTLEREALAREIMELDGRSPNADSIRFARRLFATAVETPGGLKIDTIHAFCERILHMVPFEANVPARFAVLDEDRSTELLDAVTAVVLTRAGADEGDLGRARDLVAANAAGRTFDTLIRSVVRERRLFTEDSRPADMIRALRRRLGVAPERTPETVVREMLEDGLPAAEWPAIAGELRTSPAETDRRQADALLSAAAAARAKEKIELYRSVFFTDEGNPRGLIVTRNVDPILAIRLQAEQSRLIPLDDALKGAQAIERTEALFILAQAIRRGLEAEKARLGALDFDDLIGKTLALLSRGHGETAWVLYKLDRGIEHVLVDEAQDTNPEQWEILRLITEDFTAGAGAAGERIRTVFAVGDPKQSIYGFQGAQPRRFEESRQRWRRAARDAGVRFEDVPLIVSFRSAKAVLSAVDATFAEPEHFRGLSFDDTATGTVHETIRSDAPGAVELWPLERPTGAQEPQDWALPVDAPERAAPAVAVAQRIARAVRIWTVEGDEWGRKRRPGDILILVKDRSAAFFAVIRALRNAGVPVAGADRLDIGQHIAVQDLVAAGKAALLPQDDLTLAAVLKSPLVGLNDDDLMHFLAERDVRESVLDALRRHAKAGNAAAASSLEALGTWRELARLHGPFGFYATLLGPLQGRRKLVARLGSEAGDAIDAFLSLAHDAGEPETPSLTAFLSRFGAVGHEVKRDLDATGDEVRVMTVHGAKGLEAPIVILIDGCQILGPPSPLLPLRLDPGAAETIPVWSPRQASDTAILAAEREWNRTLALEEHHRLLYVAMTRAKDRLVIAPYMTSLREVPAQAWSEMVRSGLTRKAGGLARVSTPYGEIDIWREGTAATLVQSAAPEPPAAVAAPPWLHQPAPPEPEPAPPIRPSGVLGAADRLSRTGEDRFASEARLRGTLVHALLERLPDLPSDRREAAARAFVAARAPGLDNATREQIVLQALGVLGHEQLGPLFGPGSRAEVAIAGEVLTAAGRKPVSGQIDRLAVCDGEVLIADFKTTARPPQDNEPVPAAALAQLALYRALVGQIYPDRRVRTFAIWTAGPAVRELGGPELEEALALIATEPSPNSRRLDSPASGS